MLIKKKVKNNSFLYIKISFSVISQYLKQFSDPDPLENWRYGESTVFKTDYSIHSKLRIFPLFWSHTSTYINQVKQRLGKVFKKMINYSELELRIPDSWIMNQFLDPSNQKFVKLPFFLNGFFQNMITLKYSAQTISVCLPVLSEISEVKRWKN